MGKKSSMSISCDECPFGDNECGWARCPTQDEWNVIKAYFKKQILSDLKNIIKQYPRDRGYLPIEKDIDNLIEKWEKMRNES